MAEEIEQLSQVLEESLKSEECDKTVGTLKSLIEKKDQESSSIEYKVQLFGAYLKLDQVQDAVDILQQLLHDQALNQDKELDLLCQLADVQERDDLQEVENRIQERLKSGKGDEQEIRLQVVSEWANEGMEHGSDENLDTAFGTLKRIVERSAPDPQHVHYHECYLNRANKAVAVAELGSLERYSKRTFVLRLALNMLEGGSTDRSIVGGCTSPLPFETALRILEISEEVMGTSRRSSVVDSSSSFHKLQVSPSYRFSQSDEGLAEFTCSRVGTGLMSSQEDSNQTDVMSKVAERVGLRLAHAFPWNANGQVQVALAKARRERPQGICGIMSQNKRSKMIYELKQGLENGASGVSGWLQLAELYMDDEQPELAIKAASKGLQYVQKRYKDRHEPMIQASLFLKLVYSRALAESGKLEEAEQAFNQLLDTTSEGQMSLSSIAGLLPVSIRQQALRGLAQVSLKQGDLAKAKFRYERIMGKALLAHSPTEHWAYGEYGWILFLEGDYEGAKVQLETAIAVAEKSVACTGELGSYHYRLGRTYWELGEDYRTKLECARQQFIKGAQMNGDFQAESFTWLGHYYLQIQRDEKRAVQLYQKALALDPKQAANIPDAEILVRQDKGESIPWWELTDSRSLLQRTDTLLERVTG